MTFDLRNEIDKETEAYKHDSEVYKARFAKALDKVYDDARLARKRSLPKQFYGANVFALDLVRAIRKGDV